MPNTRNKKLTTAANNMTAMSTRSVNKAGTTKSTSKPTNTKSVSKSKSKSKSKSSEAKTKTTATTSKGLKTKAPYRREDYEVIHSWLDSKANFRSVFGHSGQTPIGNLRSPQEAWDELAELLRNRSKNRLRVDGRAVKERFIRYKKKYVDAKVASRRTGFGITDEDCKKGIYSIEAKLESQCPLYSRMDKLFGAKPYIVPLGEMCMNQTNYIHGVDGFDENEDEEEGKAEEEEEEEQEVEEESEREEHEAEDVIEGEGDEEQQVDDGENIGTIEEPSESLQTLAAVAVNRIEAGSQAFQSIDLERSGNYTFGDNNYEDMFDNNNNYDLGPEEEEAFLTTIRKTSPSKKRVIEVMKEVQEKRLNFDIEGRISQNNLESKRFEYEQKKLDSEKEQLMMRLKHEVDMDTKKQKSTIITAALASGLGPSEIKDLVALVDNGLY
ncbi:hypothetical protein BG003_010805 [Podila horticola]|nr:hypothetical protein BG003_010805 [Podila horticola]